MRTYAFEAPCLLQRKPDGRLVYTPLRVIKTTEEIEAEYRRQEKRRTK